MSYSRWFWFAPCVLYTFSFAKYISLGGFESHEIHLRRDRSSNWRLTLTELTVVRSFAQHGREQEQQWEMTMVQLLCSAVGTPQYDCVVLRITVHLMAEPVNNLKSRELSHVMVEVNALGSQDEVSCPAPQCSRPRVGAVLLATSGWPDTDESFLLKRCQTREHRSLCLTFSMLWVLGWLQLVHIKQFFSTSLSLAENSGHLIWVRQEQRYPFLLVCAVVLCVQTVVWLPVFGGYNMHTDVDACDCTQGLYRHLKRVCSGSGVCTGSSSLGEKSLATTKTLLHFSETAHNINKPTETESYLYKNAYQQGLYSLVVSVVAVHTWMQSADYAALLFATCYCHIQSAISKDCMFMLLFPVTQKCYFLPINM